MTFLLDFIVAFVVSVVLLPLILRYARHRRLLDAPEARKIHTVAVPRLGGVGVFWGWAAALIATVIAARLRHGHGFPEPRFWGFVLVAAGFHALGLVDDLKNLSGRAKLAVQLLLACIAVASGYRFYDLSLPGYFSIGLGWVSLPLSVLWIVGIANAVNLLDGMDGMAGGFSFIAFGIWAAYFLKDGQYLPTVAAIAGAGATLGFLFYNFPPATLFMGDSGSLFLGFLIAALPMMGGRAGSEGASLAAAVTVCLLPILDTLAAILRRWRWKVSFFTPDRYHVHHKLLAMGFSTRQVLAYIYSACASLGAVVLMAVYTDARAASALMVAAWALGAGAFVVLHYIKERGIRLGDGGEGGRGEGPTHG